jgi:hypothetical protein
MEKLMILRFLWRPGTERENTARWNTQLFFTYPKTDAILNKIANIFPSKCYKIVSGFYQFKTIN